MNREAQILEALQGNIPSEHKRALVAELNTIRAKATKRVAVAREVELGKEAAAAHLTPAQTYVRHTTETDWLGRVASTRHTAAEIHQMAKSAAASWFRQTAPIARANPTELNIQAVGQATLWAGQFGDLAPMASSSFLQSASHLAGVKFAADENDDPEEDQDDPEESYEEADDDDDTVQRVFRGRVMGQQTDVYAEEVGEAAYQASSYRSNDFGGHVVGSLKTGAREYVVSGSDHSMQQREVASGGYNLSFPRLRDGENLIYKGPKFHGMGAEDYTTMHVFQREDGTEVIWEGVGQLPGWLIPNGVSFASKTAAGLPGIAARAQTKFTLCPAHKNWFSGDTRYRMAETFGEGGPGSGPSCSGDGCKIAPGTDLFWEGICDQEYSTRDMSPGNPFQWSVNSAKSASRKTAGRINWGHTNDGINGRSSDDRFGFNVHQVGGVWTLDVYDDRANGGDTPIDSIVCFNEDDGKDSAQEIANRYDGGSARYGSRTAEWAGEKCNRCGGNNVPGSDRCSHCNAAIDPGNKHKTSSISMDDVQRWCDRNGCVMKDFPDELIEAVAESGDLEQLGSYLEDMEAAEIGQYEGSRRSAAKEAKGKTKFGECSQTRKFPDGRTMKCTRAAIREGGKCQMHTLMPNASLHTAGTMDDVERGFNDAKNGSERFPGETFEWQVGYDAAEEGRSLDDAMAEAEAQWDSDEAMYGRGDDNDGWGPTRISPNSSRRTASDYKTEGPWKVQVTGSGENVWSGNSLRFDTPEEAKSYASDLLSRWMGADMARVVPSDTPNRAAVDLADPAIVINWRKSSSRRTAEGIDSPSPDSQNGYAESTLPDVGVTSAPEDTNMGWIAEGDSNAVTGSMGHFEAMFMGKQAGLYPDENAKGVTTWADGYGNWHATADSPEEARKAIERELADRGDIDPQNYEVEVKLVDGRHYVEAPPQRPEVVSSRKVAGSVDEAQQAVLDYSRGKRSLKKGDRVGQYTVTDAGFDTVQFAGPDDYSFAIGTLFSDNGTMTDIWYKAMADMGTSPDFTASRKHAEADGINSPSPQSQNGYAESTLPNVEVATAPENTNLGWIAESDSDADPEGAFDLGPDYKGRYASRRTAGADLYRDALSSAVGKYDTSPAYRDAIREALETADEQLVIQMWNAYVDASDENNRSEASMANVAASAVVDLLIKRNMKAGSLNARFASLVTAGENDRPAGAAPMVDHVMDESDDDNDMFGGEWVHDELAKDSGLHPDDDPNQGPGYLDDSPNLLGDPPGMDPEDYDMFAPEAPKQAAKTAMPSPAEAGISVGDIFYNSWGYDQTNVDFYKVIRLTGAGAEVVPIGSKYVEQNGPGGNKVVPDPDHIRDWDVITGIERGSAKKSKVCKITSSGGLVLRSGEHWASKWRGGSMYETDSMFGR